MIVEMRSAIPIILCVCTAYSAIFLLAEEVGEERQIW